MHKEAVKIKKATIKDIAQLAEVSVSTVSRVLAGNPSISKETSIRVRKAAQRLNYMPNTAARALRCDKSNIIGVVLPDISGEFYAGCASALLKYARKAGYSVFFIESGHELEAEKQSLCAIFERRVDGIIFVGDNNDEPLIRQAAALVPIVTADRTLHGIPSVSYNNRETMAQLVNSLYDSGIRRFVYVGETTYKQDNLIERHAGFVDALSAKIDVKYETVLDSSLHGDKAKVGYELFKSRLSAMMPELIVTSNDLITQGVISAAHEQGLRIPEDLAVTGFDDLAASEYFLPPITTIRQDIDMLARISFEKLMELLDGRETYSEIIRQEIIWRRSAVRS